MARMRTVKPALRTSAVVASWPFEVRYAWVLLWGYLDDKGRGLDLPKAIAGDCFPLDEAVTGQVIEKWLDAMTVGLDGQPGPLCRYEVGNRAYLHAVNWDEHQKPGHPSPSQHPPCPIHEPLMRDSRGNGESKPATTKPPPSSENATHEPLMRPSPLEGLRGRGFEGEKPTRESLTSSPPPPSRYCPKHQPNGTTDSCRACGTARKTAEAWEAERRARATEAPYCPKPGHGRLPCTACASERKGAT